MTGDLSKLTPEDRLLYYAKVCESVGINPLTKPFDYLNLNGKLVLYANRNCTEQLRRVHQVSIKIAAREKVDDLYVVSAQATDKTGRTDEAIGAVNLGGLKGEALANACMKAETKAKRRVTLSLCGLGMLDETETVTIPGAKQIRVDAETGEILDPVTSVHKPTDGAESAWTTLRRVKVHGVVDAMRAHLDADRPRARGPGIQGGEARCRRGCVPLDALPRQQGARGHEGSRQGDEGPAAESQRNRAHDRATGSTGSARPDQRT